MTTNYTYYVQTRAWLMEHCHHENSEPGLVLRLVKFLVTVCSEKSCQIILVWKAEMASSH